MLKKSRVSFLSAEHVWEHSDQLVKKDIFLLLDNLNRLEQKQ